jgi:uncharacterized membrane protein
MDSLPAELDLSRVGWDRIALVPGLMFNTTIKIPFVLADTLTACILYRLVRGRASGRDAALVAALWYLNPYTIWISSAWGMFDSLPVFFAILASKQTLEKRNAVSAVCLAISAAYKLYAFFLLVPFLLYLKKNSTTRNLLTFAGAFSVTSAFLFLPVWSEACRVLLAIVGLTGTTHSPSLSAIGTSDLVGFGLTYWSVGLVFQLNGRLVVACSLILLLFGLAFVWRRSLSETHPDLFQVQLSTLLVFFLCYPVIPEQFFMWAVPYLAILSQEQSVRKIQFWSCSAVAFVHSVTQLTLPYYMLPLAQRIGGLLTLMVDVVRPYRMIGKPFPGASFVPSVTVGSVWLAFLGILFSIIILSILVRLTIITGTGRPDLAEAGSVCH